jgi:hypothetical protein
MPACRVSIDESATSAARVPAARVLISAFGLYGFIAGNVAVTSSIRVSLSRGGNAVSTSQGAKWREKDDREQLGRKARLHYRLN